MFVPGAFPGDRVIPLSVHDRGSWGRATAWNLDESSPERRTPACEYAERCGGCDWMAWSREAQIQGKQAVVVDAMRRTGGIEVAAPSILAPGPELGWRGRVRLTVTDDGAEIGFVARGSHDVVPIERCVVATDGVNEGITRVRELAREGALHGVASVELRSAPRGAPVVARAHMRERGTRPPVELTRRLPAGFQAWPLPRDVVLEASPESFTQVHDEGNLSLVDLVLAGVGEGEGCVVDACCGAGNFTLPLMATHRRVRAFDQSRAAIADLRRSAEAQGLVAEDIRVARMEAELRRLAQTRLPVDAVVLDPPRSGAKAALPALLRLAPARIVYVACDPVSLARDTKSLVKGGYSLEALSCVDLFPQTHHVESVAVFVKK